ncbi:MULTISPECIES: hypothetical protein [unclassified Mycolicibacterium]|uniref:hypothetical protein n=1 Tax=unclassified Mycolicibacterium TaxID=2636767 RepID=UPI0012DC26D0|nr:MULTISPECIES: hypothetical protein [unclassified Mycolicibacterium]MUL82694.1 hypothetical protein [Mycolicibacterium sp. CBMA 329]MUL89029.1 hypothetical protein [Mycolicibacterium sp. CBMA 331]MUL97596.1 hypothetical protein [Mycolicibacterium sp. CBMA 334]MUM29371.1 hypothetical protein [Mycolicibacterium sp. CBMA 295]MUM38545.1 hypothetical protein [Mycolicibacterium sp. CBMA 247]
MSINRDELRALVREVVRDAVREAGAGLKTAPVKAPAPPPAPAPAPPTVADQMGLQPTGPRAVDGKHRAETVQLANDRDLDNFVRKLLRLFESPKTRADLKAGRLSFRLAGKASAAGPGAIHRIETGAVTERHIADLAGGTLVLGRKAVLTPLAREKARTLGITIEKERK